MEDQVCQPEDQRTGFFGGKGGGSTHSKLQICRITAPLQLNPAFVYSIKVRLRMLFFVQPNQRLFSDKTWPSMCTDLQV